MKKYLLTLAAFAFLFAACNPENEKPEKDETPAELVSFKLLATDNEALEADYAPDQIASEMIVRIPGGGQGKTLVATLEAGENDVIKVNDKEVENGKASFDATFAVDIVVTNTKSEKVVQYEVKIGKILQTVATKLTEFKTPSGDLNYTSSYYKTATNPVTGETYLAYTYGSTRNIGVVKFDGKEFTQVGPEGLEETATGQIGAVAFDSKGTPYLAYLFSSKVTLRKFNGTEWELVGRAIGEDNANTSYPPTIFFDSNDNPGVAFTSNTKASSVYRSPNVQLFNGTDWVAGSLPQFPIYDSSKGTANVFYGAGFVGKYAVATGNNSGFYLYEMDKDSWKLILGGFYPETEGSSHPANLSAAVKKDGTLLVFIAKWEAGAMQLYRLNGTSLEAYGNTIPCSIGSTSADAVSFAVNPVTDQIIALKLVEDKVQYTFLDENLQWGEFTPLAEDALASRSGMSLTFDPEGNAIVIYPEDKQTQSFQVYKIGLEDDILPE